MSCNIIYFILTICLNILGYWCQSQGQNNNYCYAKDDVIHALFNKYTPYEFVYYKNKLGKMIDGCIPIHLTMISRSGNHYPGAKTMKKINDIIPTIRSNLQKDTDHLCPEDASLMSDYDYEMDENNAKKLTPQGIKDFVNMAERKIRDFPEIFNRPYSPELFKFYDGGSRSTKESALALALGFWKSSDIIIEESDSLRLKELKETCRGFKHSDDVMKQYKDFFNSDIVAQSVSNINIRLGYSQNNGLTKEEVNTLFKACGFDTARNLNGKSPYCVPFTPQDLEIFDYLQDLLRYYRYVRGKQESRTLAYPLLSKIYNCFQKIVSQNGADSNNPIAEFYFPFWGVRNSILATLGLINTDTAINSSGYANEVQREFKSSQLDPYSSNIDVILYQCENGEKYRVMIRLQEKPISLIIDKGAANSNGLYGWQEFSTFIQSLTYSGSNQIASYVSTGSSQLVTYRKYLLKF
ncbi:multiple inositol polyphosphate phosphatase 1-like [Planococcus citri]|uniref:multiple inositol polyphosphate phosphatase 1-like n=1 Tax=Planococcus citri TaxID=170843 RepID=UPI0031F9C6BF